MMTKKAFKTIGFRTLCSATLMIALMFAVKSQAQSISTVPQMDEMKLIEFLRTANRLRANQAEILSAINSLQELAKRQKINSPETYRVLTEFIDFRVEIEYLSTPSDLNFYPAMLALWYSHDSAIPAVVEVLATEPENSLKYKNALWMIIYIKNVDFREAYGVLAGIARHTREKARHDKLMRAAMKAAVYDPDL